jgi:hypothetical protein
MTEPEEVKARRRRTRQEVQRLVREFATSGLPRGEFCRIHGMRVWGATEQNAELRVPNPEHSWRTTRSFISPGGNHVAASREGQPLTACCPNMDVR